MRPLDDARRRRLLTWSALCCAVSLCLAPIAGRSSFELAGERAAFNSRFTTPTLQPIWTPKPVSVARDPFMPEAGMQVTQGDPLGFALPPNRGAAGTPLQGGAFETPRVTAVVTGALPRALIDDGTQVRVVAVGDMLAGSRVIAIDQSGVHLQTGAVLSVAEDRL